MARAKGAKGAKGVSLTTGKSVGMAGEFREDQFQKVNLLKDIQKELVGMYDDVAKDTTLDECYL